jgi:hypothetical protein
MVGVTHIYYEKIYNTIQAWLDVIVIDYYMHGIYGLKCELYSCCRFLKFIKWMVVLSIIYHNFM